MEKSFEDSYQNGLNSLEELGYLSDPSIAPMLQQIQGHFANAKNSVSMGHLTNLRSLVKSSMKHIFSQYFIENELAKHFHFTVYENGPTLEKWNELFDYLPQIIKVLKVIKLKESIFINLNNNGMTIEGSISLNSSLDGGLEDVRKEVYAVTRELFKSKVLMTYSLNDSKQAKFSNLKLEIDYSHSEREMFTFPLIEYQLGFSNTLQNYIVKESEVSSLENHKCIEILPNGKTKEHEKFPTNYIKKHYNRLTLVHFSFLFRPLSLIIPYKGQLLPRYSRLNWGDTGSAIPSFKKSNNIIKSSKKSEDRNVYYMDLFSFISN